MVGSIEYIFKRDDEIKFAVQRQFLLNPEDDFLRPFVVDYGYPACLYSTCMASALEEVEVDWIITQCVRYHLDKNSDIILKLLMVSEFSPLHSCVCLCPKGSNT